ncbi:hypothetical protein D3C75_768210 [compost metagenome]
MAFRRRCAHIAGMPVKIDIDDVTIHRVKQTEHLRTITGAGPGNGQHFVPALIHDRSRHLSGDTRGIHH